MNLTIQFDPTPMLETLTRIREVPALIPRVLNRSMQTAHAFTARELARAMRLKNATVRQGLTVRQASANQWEARMAVSGRRLPLTFFKPKKDPLGIRAMLPDGADLFRGAFFAETLSGHRGVFIRRQRGAGSRPERRGPKPASPRRKGGGPQGSWLPIDEIFTWSRARGFTELGNIAEDTQRVAADALVKNVQADVRYILTRPSRPARVAGVARGAA